MSPLANNALATAVKQLGVVEVPKGSNKGPEVEIYLASVGLGGGYAWCMAFVYWCVAQAGGKNPLLKTAGVLHQWNNRQGLRVATPQAGDIFIMDYGKGNGHTGFVEKVLPGGMIQTIEGNTNNGGSREGYAVCRRTRSIAKCKGFLRI